MTRWPFFKGGAAATDRAASRDDERALEVLARRCGLRRGAVETLRTLSGYAGAPPVALIVSEHAFLRACAELERDAAGGGVPEPTRAAIAKLRERLFSEP